MGENATPLRAAVYGRESQANTKSIDDQVSIGTDAIGEQGWTHAGSYDDGTSASRYATKSRPGWDRLLVDLGAGTIDVLVLWETTRGSREPIDWFTLLNLCRERGVLIHVVSDERTYDPRRSRDYKDLANAGVDGAYESDKISERVQRGVLSAAKAGRPAMGVAPYGYRRVRVLEETDAADPKRRRAVRPKQEVDPETAPLVRRMYDQVARSVPLGTITRQLNDEGITTRTGRQWTRKRVRDLVLNPVYIGRRIYRRQGRNGNGTWETFPGDWEPLVSEELYWSCHRILTAPGRTKTVMRPGRQVHLLSSLATCHRGHGLRAIKGARYYQCQRGCVVVRKDTLDELVEAVVVETLASRKVYRKLRKAGELSDAEAQAARDEAARLRARLVEYRQRARRGDIDPDDFAEIAAGLRADIKAADARADQAALPPALRRFVEPGADVEARWDDATVQAKRDVIRALATVTVHPVGHNPRIPVAERVDIDPRV